MPITLPFFLRDINYLTRKQAILKLWQASSTNIYFSKNQPLLARSYKRIDKTGRMVWSQFSIKIIGLHFGNSVLDNSDWDKISHSLTKKFKKSTFQTECNSLCDEKKKRIVNRILLPKLWYRLDIYYLKIYQRRNWKKTKAQTSVWKCRLGILDIDAQLNSLELKWTWRLFNPTNALWKGLILH